ncbi:MAG: dephospho-CoA kinase [candidate division WOR-3 bacterium]|nr:dephospho-CoA kinase [candidate division WOR-3 bacterium]
MRPGLRVVIGLAGNVGTGKTTAAKVFADLGASCISADKIGWEVLPEISLMLQRRFGKEIMKGRKIDKIKLRDLVFADRAKLNFLNRLSHPLLVKKIIKEISCVKSGIVIVDAALLFDWPEICALTDYTMLMTARDDIMSARAKAKGIDEKVFSMIRSMQKSEKELSGRADFVISNNGTLTELRKKCKEIYRRIKDDC